VVTVFTPAGYGKTTLLHEVAHAVDEPAVLIPLDAAANDPAVMIDRISDALTSTGALSPSGRTWAEISMVVDGMPPDWHGLILFDDVQSVVEPAANP